MPNACLSGPVPTELGRMSRLRAAEMSRNRKNEPLPSELGQRSKLMALSLRDNRISGWMMA